MLTCACCAPSSPVLKPLSVKSDAQSDRLDAFYTGQASLYDQTRSGLLKGRTAMLQLAASHLKAQNQQTGRKKIWVRYICFALFTLQDAFG